MSKSVIMTNSTEATNSVQKVDPKLCPLCAKDNACGNLICDAETKLTCWCQDPNIQFPPQLLQQVPDDLKNKTCICRSCAREFMFSE